MKKLNKQTVETAKTVVIAVLVSAIVAFISGMAYANKQQSKVDNAVASVQAETSVKK